MIWLLFWNITFFPQYGLLIFGGTLSPGLLMCWSLVLVVPDCNMFYPLNASWFLWPLIVLVILLPHWSLLNLCYLFSLSLYRSVFSTLLSWCLTGHQLLFDLTSICWWLPHLYVSSFSLLGSYHRFIYHLDSSDWLFHRKSNAAHPILNLLSSSKLATFALWFLSQWRAPHLPFLFLFPYSNFQSITKYSCNF